VFAASQYHANRVQNKMCENTNSVCIQYSEQKIAPTLFCKHSRSGNENSRSRHV